jgi:hypothetical protein
MKVLHLRDAGASGVAVTLHPQVTVVRGLDPVARAWLIDVLGRLSGGGDLPATGEIDAHGIRFDLDPPSLALLGLDTLVGAVVTAADLPGHDPALATAAATRSEAARRRDELAQQLDGYRAALTSAVAERDQAAHLVEELARGEGPAREALEAAATERTRLEWDLQSSRDERAAREEAVAAAIAERDRALAARDKATLAVTAAQDRRRDAIAAATQAAAAVEEARSSSTTETDPEIVLAEARAALASAEAEAAGSDPAGGATPVARRLADLERRRAELVRIQVAMGPSGSTPVAEALDHVLGASDEAPPVVAALALADTWRDLHQQISALEAGVSPEERAAEERVTSTRRAVIEAEADFNQPILTPEQIAKVEAVHAAALEAQDRTEGRFGGSRSRKKLEEARAEERRVLERLGFSTYADYMMSSSSRGVGPANRAILEAARNQLTAAEAALSELPGASDRLRRRTELLQRRDAVAPRVAALLGHEPTGPEAEDELRLMREPVGPDEAALSRLAVELTRVGIDVGPAPYERDELVLLGQAFLAEERAAEDRRTETDEAVAALDRAIDEARSARDRGAADAPPADLPPLAEPTPRPEEVEAEADERTLREARWAAVEACRAQVASAEAEWKRRQSGMARLNALEAVLTERTVQEAAAAAAVVAAEADLRPELTDDVDRCASALADAEAELAVARAAEEEAAARITESMSASGAEPLVAAAQQRQAAAEGALASIAAAEQATASALAAADAALNAAVQAEEAAVRAATEIDRSTLVDDVDWKLLSRLAAVRSVGVGGSVPLVLDDPFRVLEDDEVGRVLDRVAKLAAAVQVVLISNDDAVASWAHAVGPEHASVHAA